VEKKLNLLFFFFFLFFVNKKKPSQWTSPSPSLDLSESIALAGGAEPV
jgi:hypothetical protein